MSGLKRCILRVTTLLVSLLFSLLCADAADSQTVDSELPPGLIGAPVVQYENGLLSVQAIDASLRKLLDEIAVKTDLAVVGEVVPDQRISVAFHALGMDEALRHILRDRSFIFLSRQHSNRQSWLQGTLNETLWMFPKTDGRSVVRRAVDDETHNAGFAAESISLEPGPGREDTDGWIDTIIELGDMGDPAAEAQLADMMWHEHADVREAAIESLAEIGGDSAAVALAGALVDADPRVREQVVVTLGEIGGEIARGLLEQTLSDESSLVREAAAEMLEELSNNKKQR